MRRDPHRPRLATPPAAWLASPRPGGMDTPRRVYVESVRDDEGIDDFVSVPATDGIRDSRTATPHPPVGAGGGRRES